MGNRKIKNPSTLQVCLPVEAHDALAELAAFEGSSLSVVSRRILISYLAQTGLVPPPRMKAASQPVAAS